MKVYACPEHIKAPEIDFRNYSLEKEIAAENAHKAELTAWLKANGYKGKHTGKVLRIPHADGYAQYMVADGPKSFLVHLPYGDAWDSPHASYMPKKTVLENIAREEAMNRLFAAKRSA